MIFFVYLALIIFAGLLLQWMIQEDVDTHSESVNQQHKKINRKYYH